MDFAELTISQIRQQLAAESDDAVRRRWCEALRGDTRSGARALGESGLRQLETTRLEGERLSKLFALRRELVAGGARFVAGVDEVGVGPLAGPVVAAAVALPDEVDLVGLNDSKKLSAQARERLDAAIREQALGYGIGSVEVEEIDRFNIFRASLEAMRRAVASLHERLPLDHLLVDAREVPDVAIPQTPLVHGDAIDGSIAAASIVAKVHRDALMRELDARHPGYGFVRHMGYGTAEHMAALERLGATPAHRRSFAPVAAVVRGRVSP